MPDSPKNAQSDDQGIPRPKLRAYEARILLGKLSTVVVTVFYLAYIAISVFA